MFLNLIKNLLMMLKRMIVVAIVCCNGLKFENYGETTTYKVIYFNMIKTERKLF